MSLAARIKSFFIKHTPVILTSKNNVLIIQAYPKKRRMAVSYKGKVVTSYFTDNTLHNMMTGVRFRQNTESFLGAVAKMLEQLSNK